MDPFQRTLVIRAEAAKTGRRRTLPLHEDLVAELLRLRAVHAELLGRDPEPTRAGVPVARGARVVQAVEQREPGPAPRARGRGDPATGRRGAPGRPAQPAAHAARRGWPGRASGWCWRRGCSGTADPKLTARVYTHVEVEDLRAAVVPLPGSGLAVGAVKGAG